VVRHFTTARSLDFGSFSPGKQLTPEPRAQVAVSDGILSVVAATPRGKEPGFERPVVPREEMDMSQRTHCAALIFQVAGKAYSKAEGFWYESRKVSSRVA
jgi:hypothetical protein